MFSWSTNRTRTDGGTATESPYPGHRASSVAPVIEGSIRPPSSSSSYMGNVYSSSPTAPFTGYTRQQHLDSYLKDATLSRSTRRVAGDSSSFDTVFQTVSGETLMLRVTVPNTGHDSLPLKEPPRMHLAGVRARHDWLDSSMKVTGFSAIANSDAWVSSKMTLGSAVHQVVKHLQLNPPTVLEFHEARLHSMQSSVVQQRIQLVKGTVNGSAAPPPPDYNATFLKSKQPPVKTAESMPIPQVDLPQVPSRFEGIESMDPVVLEELAKNDVELLAFCNELPTAQTLQSLALSVVEENARLAKEHLGKEDELKEYHAKATKLEKELKEKVKAFAELKKKQDALCAPPNVAELTQQLTLAKKEALDASEQIAEDWVDEGGPVVDFCNKFMEIRTLHHLRAAKLEVLETQKPRTWR